MKVLLLGLAIASSVSAFTPLSLHLLQHRLSKLPSAQKADVENQALADEFPEQFFTQPLSHFPDSSLEGTNHTWQQRYWVSTRHFNPSAFTGGKANPAVPVIVLDGGETSGEGRLPFLDTGIVDILAKATGGVGVILEHRYYGTSLPVANFTTDSLRWLNNEQAAADSANFMKNFRVTVNGTTYNLGAPSTPWIYYGGSYAGARAAHMRVLYPSLVWGAISSSGVTEAAISNWGYWDVIRRAAPANCSAQIVKAIKEVDDLVARSPSTNAKIKAAFGVPGLVLDGDFGSLLFVLSGYQSQNWDPAIGSKSFARACAALGNPSEEVVVLPQGLNVSTATFNLAVMVNRTTNQCETTAEECFGTRDDAIYADTDISQDWRLWPFQVCTQWGYFDEPPPRDAESPGTQGRPPSLVPKAVDLEYSSKFCAQAYKPGQHFSIPKSPRVEEVNRLGGFNIKYDRLAIIDGEVDPWIFDTPHSWTSPSRVRPDTITQPFKVIPNAVHHYDENGIADHDAEPEEIKKIHAEEVEFVKSWLAEFK